MKQSHLDARFKAASATIVVIVTALLAPGSSYAATCEEVRARVVCDADFEHSAIYSIQRGDTLWDISTRSLCNPLCYKKVATDNQIADPDRIFAGETLLLPQADELDSNEEVVLDEADREAVERLAKLIDPATAADERRELIEDLRDELSEMPDARVEFLHETAFDNIEKISTHLRVMMDYGAESMNAPPVGAPVSSCARPETPDQQVPITIAFANGVGNYLHDAQRSKLSLERALAGAQLGNVHYDVFYNSTRGLVNDLVEVLTQKRCEGTKDMDTVRGLDAPKRFYRRLSGTLNDSAACKAQFLGKAMRRIASALTETETSQLERYRKKIAATSGGVVVVAHSQGNLFTNWAYDQLSSTERKYVGVVAIATPAGATPADTRGEPFMHFTNTGDRVINGLRILATDGHLGLAPPLGANVKHSGDGLTSHGFTNAYIGRGDPARPLVLDAVAN